MSTDLSAEQRNPQVRSCAYFGWRGESGPWCGHEVWVLDIHGAVLCRLVVYSIIGDYALAIRPIGIALSEGMNAQEWHGEWS